MGSSVVTLTFRGKTARFNVTDPDDHIQKHWLRGYFYEQGMLEFIYDHKEEIGTDGLWLDVGAYVGNHSVFFHKMCKAWYLESFEPLYYEDCERNLVDNDYDADMIHRYAVSGSKGTLSMNVNGGMSKVGGGSERSVLAVTVDKMVWSRRVDLMKIDVEGHEQEVLRGARETLENNDVWVFVEVIDGLDAVDAIMEGYGYHRTEHVFNHTPTYLYRK